MGGYRGGWESFDILGLCLVLRVLSFDCGRIDQIDQCKTPRVAGISNPLGKQHSFGSIGLFHHTGNYLGTEPFPAFAKAGLEGVVSRKLEQWANPIS